MLKDDAVVDAATAEAEAIKLIRDHLGAVASVQTALVVERLPKTRSGKILRRSLLQIVDGKAVSIPATIEDSTVLVRLKAMHTDLLRELSREVIAPH